MTRFVFVCALLVAYGCGDDGAVSPDGGMDAGVTPDAGPPDTGPPRECRHPVRPVTTADLDVLVFSKTAEFRHASIERAVEALQAIADDEGLTITHTEDATTFTDEGLAGFDAVVWLHTTGDVLDDVQQAAFERYIQAGGGYVGVHSAADTEYDWAWYGDLVGAYFRNHPLLPVTVDITTEDMCHASTSHFDDVWTFTDEIYNFDRNPRRDNHILLTVDEAGFIYPNTDEGPNMGPDHPIAWLKEFDGGRSFYTNLGHRIETWLEPAFLTHLVAGIRWAAGPLEYSRVVVTSEILNPLAIDVAPDGRVFIVERTGELYVWSPRTGQLTLAYLLPVSNDAENGLLGIALDPSFDDNDRVYLYWSSEEAPTEPDDPPGWNYVSRFTMSDETTLDFATRTDLLRVPSERACCHEGGALEFGPDGSLYVSVGDNTNPHESGGLTPIDGRPGREQFDARRTAANPMDLRGKILRIAADGSIPAGNLFADPTEGRPEIFVMGVRNPFRIAVDPESGRLFWGDVGPDGPFAGRRGPQGFDEIDYADVPGNYGWPYCIADNRPYAMYDFETEVIGDFFDCSPYEPALLYYDYFNVSYLAIGDATDPEGDPAPGAGALRLTGRTATAGVFYRTPEGTAPFALPDPYRDTLLMTEWTRDLIVSVEVLPDGTLGEVLRFAPWIDSNRPIDLDIGPDGALYVLDYGTSWYGANEDARLNRIEFSAEGALSPVAAVQATPRAGTAPLTVSFDSVGSRAPGEGDTIAEWEWDFDGDGVVDATGPTASFDYADNGVYQPTLVVIGTSGRRSLPMAIPIVVGNTAPEVRVVMPMDGVVVEDGTLLTLEGAVTDVEDGVVPCDRWQWNVLLGHNAHAHPYEELDGCTTEFLAQLPDPDEAGNHFFAIELVYRDDGGPTGEPSLTGRDGVAIGIE